MIAGFLAIATYEKRKEKKKRIKRTSTFMQAKITSAQEEGQNNSQMEMKDVLRIHLLGNTSGESKHR